MPPVPGALGAVGEFGGALRALKAVEGLSLRESQRRTGLPRTTIAHALDDKRPSLPPWDRARALLQAFGVRGDAPARWKDAWTRIRLDSAKSAGGSGEPEPGAAERPSAGGRRPARGRGRGRAGRLGGWFAGSGRFRGGRDLPARHRVADDADARRGGFAPFPAARAPRYV
ncbi:helix-turn-helix domain-containing protein [Streptomyces melanogenes]|uniref:Helix-turn-helix domain-containing protein n=1 Tax=Streptomyces melanogenes TaxID=67326 RepID=A0ABZ1XUZ3_9ACTN|nr:helix-turn-helix domain-containing protein [Streptomyces melanogenes]